MTHKVIIASENPVKINAVKAGFAKMFPDSKFEFAGVSVPSNVSEQPMTNQETKEGAFNRVNNVQFEIPEAHFWVGIEGGIEQSDSGMEAFAWIVIKSVELIGKAKTGTFFLPKAITNLVDAGKELGEADDIVFGDTNSKQKGGAVGNLTGGVLNRTDYYIQAVLLALIPHKNRNLYKS
jgi:inosine/xanthosine triphosphatase